VNFLYSVANSLEEDLVGNGPTIHIDDTASTTGSFNTYGRADGGVEAVQRKAFGEINQWYNNPLIERRMPWVYTELQRFEQSSGVNPLRVMLRGSAVDAEIGYAALEVIYCNETRLAYGGTAFGETGFPSQCRRYVMGANVVTMATAGSQVLSPTIPAGTYTVVLSSADTGDFRSLTGQAVRHTPYPVLNAVRELYSLPTHPGVQVNVPFPVDESIVGKVFTKEPTHVLPQLSLNTTSTGTINDPHVYGRQADAQVFGSITATQEILDSGLSAVSGSYPQVRFYARRFGDTVQPLTLTSPTITASSVQITPTEHDALPEIIDGWKEVTLRFATPPSLGNGTNPQWRWSATGEANGNRWEVLAAVAPALSGAIGNMFNKTESKYQLSSATYGTPVSGSQINLGWIPGYSPIVTATTDDPTADAVLLFAQDMPTVSGFIVTQLTQPLTGADPTCPRDISSCIPTGLLYNALSWRPTLGAGYDTFTRTLTGDTQINNLGQTYTLTSVPADYAANGTSFVITPSVQNNDRLAYFTVGGNDHDVKSEVMFSTVPAANDFRAGVIGRLLDSSNYYHAELVIDATGAITLRISKRVAAVQTVLQTVTTSLVGAGVNFMIRMTVTGTTLRAKAWLASDEEPTNWMAVITDTSTSTGTSVGLFARNAHTVTTYSATFDTLYAQPQDFDSYEIQRQDTMTDWQTIMVGSSAAITGFNDYEARVGLTSSYRIRVVDIYDFAGAWSSTVTSLLTAPGVSGGADIGLLLFTSNSRQLGTSNLGYSAAWSNQPQEDFVWPEGSMTALQQMYGKNFPTAFRPLERGGEQFSRVILINAAGIPVAATLNGFKDLRQMAWDTVPYICVRDELGNRWFATVMVPSGSRQRMTPAGHLEIAGVNIVEVTDTAYAVDPTVS
jgi:hypothetical protein